MMQDRQGFIASNTRKIKLDFDDDEMKHQCENQVKTNLKLAIKLADKKPALAFYDDIVDALDKVISN